jgi:hypothetical protein
MDFKGFGWALELERQLDAVVGGTHSKRGRKKGVSYLRAQPSGTFGCSVWVCDVFDAQSDGR